MACSNTLCSLTCASRSPLAANSGCQLIHRTFGNIGGILGQYWENGEENGNDWDYWDYRDYIVFIK